MDETCIQNALTYAARHQQRLVARLGHGVHGMVYVAEDKAKGGRTAVKAHRELEPYLRERHAYERLKQASVTNIRGLNVPQFIQADDELRVIEMSIVTRPFVLDFAGAYLDAPPDFPGETWAEWETAKQEQFDERWPEVRAVLAALQQLGIYMVDVSPGNVAFGN